VGKEQIGIAFGIEKFKFLIKSDERYYLYIACVVGIILILFAAIFMRDGLIIDRSVLSVQRIGP